MSKREDYESRTEELLAPIAEVNQVEMIGVAQHDLCADFFQIMCRKPAFDRGSSGNVLESRCLNRAVHSLELAAAGCTLFFNQTVWHK